MAHLPEDVPPLAPEEAAQYQSMIMDGVNKQLGNDEAKMQEFVTHTKKFGKGEITAEVMWNYLTSVFGETKAIIFLPKLARLINNADNRKALLRAPKGASSLPAGADGDMKSVPLGGEAAVSSDPAPAAAAAGRMHAASLESVSLEKEAEEEADLSLQDDPTAVCHHFHALPLGLDCKTFGVQTVVDKAVPEVPQNIIGLCIVRVNGDDVSRVPWEKTLKVIKQSEFPIEIWFKPPSNQAAPGTDFSLTPNAIPDAIKKVEPSLPEADGKMRGLWLLKSFNHFSMEQERVVAVTDRAMYRIKYDFQTQTIEKTTRIPFLDISRVQHGPLMWSDKVAAAMKTGAERDRQGLPGVRIVQGAEEVSWYQRWNPMASQPVQIFSSHIRDRSQKDGLEERSAETFGNCLIEAINEFRDSPHSGGMICEIVESTIRMEGSVVGKIYNDTSFGTKKKSTPDPSSPKSSK